MPQRGFWFFLQSLRVWLSVQEERRPLADPEAVSGLTVLGDAAVSDFCLHTVGVSL